MPSPFKAPVAPSSESKSQQALVNDLVASFHEHSADGLETIPHDDTEADHSGTVEGSRDGDILPTVRGTLPAKASAELGLVDRARDGHGRESGVKQVRGVVGKVVGVGTINVLEVIGGLLSLKVERKISQ